MPSAGTREYWELLDHFERDVRKLASWRLDRESRDEWPKGRVYQNGQVNLLWRMHQAGYALELQSHERGKGEQRKRT